jgi:hypothetical protein
MRNCYLVIFLMVVGVFGFLYTGCSGSEDMLSQMTGTWKSNKDNNPVKINLSGDQKTIEIGDNAVPVTIKKVDKGSFMVTVDVKPANGKTSEWKFRQVWNDNGSTFTIKFDHDGEQETLTRG